MCDCIYFRRNLDFLHTHTHIHTLCVCTGGDQSHTLRAWQDQHVRSDTIRPHVCTSPVLQIPHYYARVFFFRKLCAKIFRITSSVRAAFYADNNAYSLVHLSRVFFCSAATVLFLLSVCFYTPQLHVIKQTTCQQTSFEYFFYPKRHRKQKTKAPKVVQKSKLRGLTSGLRGLPGFAKDGQLATRKIKSNRIIAGSLHVSVCCCHSDFNCSFLCARPSQLSTVSSFPRNAWSGFV